MRGNYKYRRAAISRPICRMSIGARIKEWRSYRRLGQAEVSASLGIPFSTYQKYETGNRKPGADALESFSLAGVSADWLLTGVGKMLLTDQTAPAQPAPPSPIDAETLVFVIESLESALSKRKLTLDASRKANLIQLMYEYCMLDSSNKQAGTVERFLKLVA